MKRTHKKGKWLRFLGVVLALLGIAVLAINYTVENKGKSWIVEASTAAKTTRECVVVFGAGIGEDGRLSDMLADRMDVGIALYKSGAARKLLLSGDHGTEQYDEVGSMRDYALAAGVPEEDIFLDHAGFSTYETLYRAQAVFGVKSAVLVTQEYHLYRALYIAKTLDLDVVGVSADRHQYAGQWYRDLREIAARNKDFFTCLFRPEPTYLGESIAIMGDGRVTWDDAQEV